MWSHLLFATMQPVLRLYISPTVRISMLEMQTQMKLSDSRAENGIFYLYLFRINRLTYKKRREQGNIETLRCSSTTS